MVQGKLENKKIGILGGSFDPAHIGHVRISKLAKKNYNLSQVIWAITKQNPFKKNNPNDLNKRTAYAKKINKNNKFIKVKCFEEIIKSNRTVDLIKYLKKVKYPIYAATLDGINLSRQKFPSNLHLILGNESNGINDSLLDLVDTKIKIEKQGKAESLNVGIASAIFLHKILFC